MLDVRDSTPLTFKPLPTREYSNIKTFFMEGITSSRTSATKYSPVVPFFQDNKLKTVTFINAPKILHNIIPYPELEENQYNSHTDWISWSIHWLKNKRMGLLIEPHSVNWKKVSIGGDLDVKHHQKHLIEAIKNKKEHEKLVVFGFSRGASTTLVSVSTLPLKYSNKIDLIIVESPFTSITDLFEWKGSFFIDKTLSSFTSYDPNQLSPIKAIETLPLTIPIGFIMSKGDTVVPMSNTQKLIKKLHERGHQNIHVCILEKSPHSSMSIHNIEDQKRYIKFVEEMYHLIGGKI